MQDVIHMHDVVALLEDIPTTHFATDRPLMLRRGQIGTVVMTYDGAAYEVEFADSDGRAYALMAIDASKLMVLHETPQDIADSAETQAN